MHRAGIWSDLGWRHPVWELVRYYRSLRGNKSKTIFVNELVRNKSMSMANKTLPIDNNIIELLFKYLEIESILFKNAEEALRTEKQAIDFCSKNNFLVGKTKTKNIDHHQSSKSMIACVTGIAKKICQSKGLEFEPDPQNRCVWLNNKMLHVTSRNLDGAIPGLASPSIIWEIKEYWGKTKGGSKMSDAVYECQLVGRELREYEEKSGSSIIHAVFLDGKDQWSHRKSDLRRFIDLSYQGLIDHLIIGNQVESDWENILKSSL